MSIALALQARGLTQRQIADKLGVAHNTVSNWLTNFGTVPELVNEPELPDAETLDGIAAKIREQAKQDGRRFTATAALASHRRGLMARSTQSNGCGKEEKAEVEDILT